MRKVAYWLLIKSDIVCTFVIQKKSSEKDMAVKKNYRANNTRLIEGGTGDNPKLMAQGLQDGRDSLYLEYYMGFDDSRK